MSFHIKITTLLLILLAVPAFSGEKPLTDEEIVRRVITGESHDGIIALIKTGKTDFDLSDEMVEEMKLAGVPERIVQAMRERHLELNRPPEPETEEYEVPSPHALIIHLKFKKQPVLPKQVPEPLAERAGIPLDEESRRITGAALFVVCTSPTHVPDHWRGKSPLRRDFVFTPRHRMLVFEPAFEAGGDKPAPVKLTLPDSIRLELDPDEPHDLVFGLAVEAGERYLALFQRGLGNVTVEEGDIHKAVSIAQTGARTLDVTIRKVKYEPETDAGL